MDEGADSGLAPERVRRQLDSSLERLGVDRVDLYLAHEPDPATPIGETLGAFDELAAAGSGRGVRASATTARTSCARRSTRGPPGRCSRTRSRSSTAATRRAVIPLCAAQRRRLPGVRAARRRLADRQVPARRAAARGLAHDAASRAVHAVRQRGRVPRRSTALATAAPRPRREHGRARARVAPGPSRA